MNTKARASRRMTRNNGQMSDSIDGIDALYGQPLKATRTGPLFGAFPYPTKISPESIALFVAAHTRPGDVVFDGFAGSGTVGLAAMLCEHPTESMKSEAQRLGLHLEWGARNAVLYELSALGAFVSRVLTHPPQPSQFREAAETILREAEDEDGELYVAYSPEGKEGVIRYVIWSDVICCPACMQNVTLWDACVSRNPAKIASLFKCPMCNHEAPIDQTNRVTVRQSDSLLTSPRKLRLREPVWIYGTSGRSNWSRAVTQDDVRRFQKIYDETVPSSVPDVPIPWGDLYRSGYHMGITHVHQFYTRRNLIVFGRLWERTFAWERNLGDALRFWLLSYNGSHATIMSRVVAKASQSELVVTSAQPGVLYISGLPVEKNLFLGLRRKLKTIASAFDITHGLKGKVEVHQESSCAVRLADGSVDYIFTDPPFGGNIPYAEVNFINEAWLGRYTDRDEEAIISPSQGKSISDYQKIITTALTEAHRVLKGRGQATLVFHSATANVWNSLREAYTDAGFTVRYASILDKTQGSFKQVTTTGAVKGDPLLLLEKVPRIGKDETPDVWAVAEELRQHAILAADPNERTAERLYSRLIAYFLTRNQSVPLDADEFYRWHASRSCLETEKRARP